MKAQGPGQVANGTRNWRRPLARWFTVMCVPVLVIGLAACGTRSPSGDAHVGSAPAAYHPAPPAVSGHGVRALWQGAPWGGLIVAGGLVLGIDDQGGRAVVRAVSALTGKYTWATPVPGTRQQVLSLVAGEGIVVVAAGHDVGTPPAMVAPVVTEDIVLDIATGRQLWTVPVPGRIQAPPIAIAAGGIVLSGSPSGQITARRARTGQFVWQRQRSPQCPATRVVTLGDEGMSLAADGSLLTASFECQGGHVLVQRLTPATGQPAWQWISPGTSQAGEQAILSLAGAARLGGLVLLAGQIVPTAAAQALAGSVPRSFAWPASLGPLDGIEAVLALSADTGRPRWMELGGQQQSFSLADGAVCESVGAGLECRDDVTGSPSRPVLLTGQPSGASPPYGDDGTVGISGSVAAMTVAPFRAGQVRLVVVPVHGTRQVAQASLAIGTTAYHANYQTFVVAAGPLPDGGTLFLLRRVDAPGYPVIAFAVTG